MNFNHLNHIGVAVKDIERAKNLLKENFGAKILNEMVSQEQGFRSALVSLDGTTFELMTPLHEKGIIAEFINQRGDGIHHLSFEVEDLNSTESFFKEKGFKIIKQPSEVSGINAIFLHPKSFFGILVELFQRIE